MKCFLSILLVFLLLFPTSTLSVIASEVEMTDPTPMLEASNVIKNDIPPSLPTQPDIPEFTSVSVHDPSVILDDGTFYVFGSHLASAKSKDLIAWEQMTTEVSSDNPLFEDVFRELKAVFDWAETDTLWAADVIQLEDGRYYMYYNACRGDSPLSAMGLAVSDSVEGPYEDLGLFLWSGKTPNPMGITYDIDIHPNAVDPALFFDKDGQLWMVYGSYSGGIFILEMDNETGLPKEENNYGKLLTGGGVRIEASYMQYIPEEDYYYLYTTFGGLDADGGYNMRIARSKNPDGPFVDISGQDMIDAKGRPGIPFDDEAIEPYGLKLVGNYQFSNLNAELFYPVYGYVSPGHNSSYYDHETGKHYNIFHTRFPHRGEEHEVRVHLMPMNKDGWPVMAPHRYAGESLLPVDVNAIPGTYHFINHGDEISADIKHTQYIELHSDGSITGEVEGSWKLDDDYYAIITIAEETYDGVFLMQWSETEQDFVMTFTAASNEGHSIWGSQFESVSDEQFVQHVLESLSLGSLDRVYNTIDLPNQTVRGVPLNWASSDESVISSTGEVNRPEVGEGDKTVTLTVTVTYNDIIETKSFEATVKEKVENSLADGLIAHYPFNGSIEDQTGNYPTPRVTGERMDVFDGEIDFAHGADGQALYLDGTSGLHLGNGLIQNNDYTVAMWLNPEELRQFSTAFFGMGTSESWTSFLPSSHDGTTMLWSGQHWYDASTDMTISDGKWTHTAYTVNDGHVTIYINGEAKYQGTNFPDIFTDENAEFTVGVNLWDQPYKGLIDDLRIYGFALDQDVIQQLLVAQPEEDVLVHTIQLATSERNIVSGSSYQANATLYPINAEDKSVTWSTDNPHVATVDPVTGLVHALDFGKATITAKANDGSETEASFTVNVTDGKVAHYSFEGDLYDSLGISDAGTITGDRLTNSNGQISYAEGISGQALIFDGQSGVRLPNGLISDSTYSVSLWLNPSEIIPFATTFFGAPNDTNWISFVPGGPDQNNTMLWSGSQRWYDATTGTQIPTNEWTHVTFTVNEGDIVVYINGDVAYTGSDFPDIFTTEHAAFALGVNYWDLPFKGMMDELIVFDGYALSNEEVKEYYNEVKPDHEPIPKPDVKDEEILDNLDKFNQETSADGRTTFVAKQPAKIFEFDAGILEKMSNSDLVEVTDGNVRVTIPASALRSGQQVRLEMEDVTKQMTDKLTDEKIKPLSHFIRFSLKDSEHDLDFSEEGIEIDFAVNLDQVNSDHLQIFYFSSDGETKDSDAKMVNVDHNNAIVTVRVNHFSTYGIVEVLDDDKNSEKDGPSHPDEDIDSDKDEPSDPDEDIDSDKDEPSDPNEDIDSNKESIQTDQESEDDNANDHEDTASEDSDNDFDDEDDSQEQLPNTATNIFNLIFIGIWLIFFSGVIIMYNKKRLT